MIETEHNIDDFAELLLYTPSIVDGNHSMTLAPPHNPYEIVCYLHLV